jgi:glycosyltransferase involved in cell wall biosynthesis
MPRVLLISHTCQSPAEGQPKAELLHAMPDIDLRVLIPDRWKHYGQWRSVKFIQQAQAHYQVGNVRWPWFGPAQFYLHYYPELPRILREFQPEVIDLWEEPWGLVSAHAVWLRDRMLPGTKIISETEQNINRTLPPPFEQFRRYTLKHADFVIGRSREALEITRIKGYNGPGEVVPNAVDCNLFVPMDRITCRREAGLADWCGDEDFVVGYAGRLVEEKGLADLVAAIAECPREVKLLLVGDGPFKAALEMQMGQLSIADRMRIIPGVPLQKLAVLMNSMNVFALASRTTATWKEQFGRVIIEAHACAIPVIGSNSGAIPDVVGEAGLVVPESDPAALSAAIKKLNADRQGAMAMGRRGYERVQKEFSWERVAEQMARIYRRCAAM